LFANVFSISLLGNNHPSAPFPVKLLPLLLIVFSGSAILYGQNKDSPKQVKVTHAAATAKNNNYRYTITGNEQNGYGYDVFEGTKVFIRQPNIPGLPGHKGFTTKNDGEKTASLVIRILSNNIMPPTVSRHELENLKIKL